MNGDRLDELPLLREMPGEYFHSLTFIIGPRRSGTTLVNSILCADATANPQIGEAQPLTRLLDAFSWSAENYDRMTRHYLPTRRRLEDFAAATCRELLRNCWEIQGRPRHLVLKNPELAMHVERLRRYFPEARYVVCVRDPRDQIASERDVVTRRAGAAAGNFSARALAKSYRRILELILAAAEVAPECFCFVRYEDLVSDPRRQAARLGEFCGLDLRSFDPGADWRRMAVSGDELAGRPSYSPLYGKPISAARVGRFADRLKPAEIANIEKVTGALMSRFAYRPTARVADAGGKPSRISSRSDIEYVMIAEAGVLERQALLLVESIRLLPGSAGAASITVVSPRPERRPARDSIRQLERLGAEYRPLTIESPCPYYGTSFKLAAMQEIERRSGPPTLVMLDSDTLFVAPPTFDLGQRAVAVRPVDVKGMCTSGPGDPFDEYWQQLCSLCGVAYDDLPWVAATTDGYRVKASHNGGLVAANRSDGLFSTTFDFLCRSVAAGLFPRPDSGRSAAKFRIGAGEGSAAAWQIWGAAQAVLSLALLAQRLEAKVLPPTYNVPCHYFDQVVARYPQVTTGSVHVHYHWLCDGDKMSSNPLLDGRMRIPPAVGKLLRQHLPLDRPLSIGRRLRRLAAGRFLDWGVPAM